MRKLITIVTCLLFPMSALAQVNNPPNIPLSADVRGKDVILNSSGDGTWDFTNGGTNVAFGGVPDVTHMPKAVDTTNPIICNFMSVTNTSVTVHCWRTSLAGLLTGLLSGPITGATVHLIARYKAP